MTLLSAILPAAGESGRFGGGARKPFARLANEILLVHACRACQKLPGLHEIIVVAHPDDLPLIMEEHFDALRAEGMTMAVGGGGCRAASVWAGMEVISAR